MIKYVTEVKNRAIVLFFSCFLFFVVSYFYGGSLLTLSIFLNEELVKNNVLNYFIFTSMTDIFLTYLNMSFCATSYLAYFKLSYHFISFLKPALRKREFRLLNNFFVASVLSCPISLKLNNSLLLPAMSSFFLGFHFLGDGCVDFHFEASVLNYSVFYKEMLFNCFLNLQVVIIFFVLLDLVSYKPGALKKIRRPICFLLLVISTLITPPDVFSLIFSYLTLVTFFEFSVFFLILKIGEG